MVNRSIVGRFLILAVLLVSLGVIAQAALIISKETGRTVAKASAAPAAVVASPAPAPGAAPVQVAQASVPTPAPNSAPSADAAAVRVVYPGPLGDAPAPLRKIADAAPAAPAAAQPDPVPPAAAPTTPAGPVVVASADAGVQPTAEPVPPAKGGVNLNSASVEALNHLGGGHIGQSIVQHRPYRSVEDLMKKRVVRRSVYDQIKDQVAAE